MWKVPEPLASELVKDRAALCYERAQGTVRGFIVLGLVTGAAAGWMGATMCGVASMAVAAAAIGGMIGVWTGAALGRRRSLSLLMEGHETLGHAFAAERGTPNDLPN